MSPHRRLVIVIEDKERNPYEVWLLAALFVSSLIFLLGLSPNPPSVQYTLPTLNKFLWNTQLAVGTAAALIGMFWKQPTTGRTIQIVGHLCTGSGAFIYACVLFYYNGLAATLSGLLVASVTVAAILRAVQLRNQIRQFLAKVGEKDGTEFLSSINGGDNSTT